MYLNFEITTAFIDADESIIAPADASIRILLNPLMQQDKTVLKKNSDFLRLLPNLLIVDKDVLQKSFPYFDFEPNQIASQSAPKKESNSVTISLQTEEDQKSVIQAFKEYQT